MFGVPRNQRKVVVQGGGSEKPVNNRQRRSPGSCATRESSPAVGDGLIDSKDAVRKPKRQVPVQPGFEGSATLGIGQQGRGQIERFTMLLGQMRTVLVSPAQLCRIDLRVEGVNDRTPSILCQSE